MNPNELKQIEVIRGPASAVWGANAMNGVVNFISKTPRELNGNSATMTLRRLRPRRRRRRAARATARCSASTRTHARAVNDRWAYKISARRLHVGSRFPRPTGAIPNGTGTQYPTFTNPGTTQPKFDARVDYDARRRSTSWCSPAATRAPTASFHTGIGPFDMDTASASATARCATRAAALQVQLLHQHPRTAMRAACWRSASTASRSCSSSTPRPTTSRSATSTLIGTRNVLSYGGNVRFNRFDLSIAPRGDSRTELGGYIQDEIFLNNKVRLNLGARLDKFDNIEDPVFSPRVALDLQAGRRSRGPAVVQQGVPLAVAHQQLPRRRRSSIS